MPSILVFGEEFLCERYCIIEKQSFLPDEVRVYDLSVLSADVVKTQISIDEEDERRVVYIIKNFEALPLLPDNDRHLYLYLSKEDHETPSFVLKRQIPPLKIGVYKNEVLTWIHEIAEEFNIDLSKVSSALFVNSGNRPRKLVSEIRKISELSNKTRLITPEIARSVMVFSAELTPKIIVDSINQGNKNAAINAYDKLQESKDETGWIITFLQNHFDQLYRYERLASQNVSPDLISSSLNVTSFILNSFIAPLRGLWTIESIQQTLKNLYEAEIAHKTGVLSSSLILESEIIRLSEEAFNVISNR